MLGKSQQFKFFFYKNKGRPFGTILFKKSTAEALIMHNKSVNYIEFNETISPVKLFGASLNRNSGKNQRQKQS
jgi:hypothetical protein